MSTLDRKSLVDGYIGHRTWVWDTDMVLRKKHASDDAEAALYDLVWSDAAAAWEVMREIARATANSGILSSLANGPLHQLLIHSPRIMDAIEQHAEADEAIRRLLSFLWDDDCSSFDAAVMARVR